MNTTVVVLLLFVLLLYAYKNHNREFEATASAIRQIWSGSCRLSCRQSEYSSFSGLSGLDKQQCQVAESSYSDNTNHSHAGVSDCVCDTCPCALIENVLRTCRPATNLYNKSIEFISRGYYDVLKALTNAHNYVGRVADCGVSCQKESQLLSIKSLESVDNISFVNKTAVRAVSIKKETDPIQEEADAASAKKETGSNLKKREVASPKNEDLSKRKVFELNKKSSAVESPKNNAEDNTSVNNKKSDPKKYSSGSECTIDYMESERKSCAKCIEKGKICIDSCPRANKKSKE